MKNIFFTALFVFAILSTVSGQFKEGYIIDKYGEKYIGLVKVVEGTNGAPDYLIFKESQKSDKVELPREKLKSFAIGADSFSVVNNFRVPAKKTVLNGFAQITMVTPNGYLCELKDLNAPSSSPSMQKYEKMYYLILRKDVYTLLTKPNFQKEMGLLIEDSKELAGKVKAKKLIYDEIDQIVETYNKSK